MPIRRRSNGLGILLLLGQLYQFGFHRIPPVTLGTIGLNTAIFLDLLPGLPRISQVCISVRTVWYGQQWTRLVLGAFFHASDMHLYYNMISFLWKGFQLEKKFGSLHFLFILSLFTVSTNVLLVALSYVLGFYTDKWHYITDCGVGFSGVIFAVKVVATYLLPPSTDYVMSLFPISSRYACWAELILIQLLVPNSSFLGHLAGIIVGLLYIKSPLGYIFDLLFKTVTGRGSLCNLQHRQRFQSSGITGYRQFNSSQNRANSSTRRSYETTNPTTDQQSLGQSSEMDNRYDRDLQTAIEASLHETNSYSRRPAASAPALSNTVVHNAQLGTSASSLPHNVMRNSLSTVADNSNIDAIRAARLARFQRRT